MAPHGPSFRFAAPRTKDQSSAQTAEPSSRLPLRANTEPDMRSAGAIPQSLVTPGKPSEYSQTERSPSKLRRKNIPNDVRAKIAAQEINRSLGIDNEGNSIPGPPRSIPKPPVSKIVTSNTTVPVASDVVSSVVTPNSSQLPTSAHAAMTPTMIKSNTLRRKPSIIGTYASAQRSGDSSVSPNSASQMSTRQSAANVVDFAPYQKSGLRSTQEISTVRQYSTEPEPLNWRPITTPLSEMSATPSLRHTDSPSVFSTAASVTPTSQTSYSPMIATSPHFGPAAWNSPVKSVHELRLGTQDDRWHSKQSKHQNGKRIESPSSTSQSPAAPVPELAHLMIDAVVPTMKERQPPPRPSREGTPNLGNLASFPVVFSNLPAGAAGRHRRQSSSSAPDTMPGPDVFNASKSVTTSPNRPVNTQARPSTSGGTSSHRSKPQEPTMKGNISAHTPPTLGTSPKPTSSRFGFLHRKDKIDLATAREEVARQSKKGPTAGTGHEGYRKYPAKGRNGSSTSLGTSNSHSISIGTGSQTSSNRKSNGSSTKSDTPSDSFLLQRQAPVYLRGSGAIQEGQTAPGHIVRSESSSSVDEASHTNKSHVTSPNLSSISPSSFDPPQWHRKPPATPQSGNTSISSRTGSSRGRGSWGSVSRGPDRQTSRERGREALLVSATAPISESSNEDSASAKSSNTQAQEDTKVKKSNWSFFSKSSQKPKAPQKWHFFPRSHTSPEKDESVELPQSETEIPNPSRTVAHYAMPENKEHFDFRELENLMEEADALQREFQYGEGDKGTGYDSLRLPQHDTNSIYHETAHILASHLKLSPELYDERVENGSIEHIPITERSPDEERKSAIQTGPRQSRLAQVGRIPKVVSRRDRLRTLPAQSFSRPFAGSQHRPDLSSPQTSSPEQPTVASPSQPSTKAHAQELNSQSATEQRVSALSRASGKESDPRTNSAANSIGGAGGEFFSIHRRANSDLSMSSSSGTPYLPSAISTAKLSTLSSAASEDEIWQEYDDLIDHVLTPQTSRNGTTPADEIGPLDSLNNQPSSSSVAEQSLAASKTAAPNLSEMASSLRPDLSPFVGTKRRSEIFSGFEHPAVSPVMVGFGEQDPQTNADNRDENNGTEYSASRPSNPQPLPAYADSRASEGDPDNKLANKDNIVIGSASHLNNAEAWKLTPKSMATLRFGALMTSKWLSFGRVLFSPGLYQLSDSKNDRVLVVDGLGKDWSYFCALTYPNTTIYSLGPEPSQSSSNRHSLSAWQPLTNHRHFCHPKVSENFPFPKNFFNVVVFRFPIVTSESDIRLAISECKRVLQPGGYIEVSALDLDLTNMGNKARKSVRSLKTKMQETHPDVCLKPMSDNIQYLLGRRGFENLSRCVVGVPVAGVIADSRGDSSSENEMSFTELVADTSKSGDDAMTKMVAKVGRWWYTKTYETCVLPGGDVSRSIWNDMELLRECEGNHTTFKLLICYAQKPSIAKRRTVSL